MSGFKNNYLIGSGAGFPIKLTTKEVEKDGVVSILTSWEPLVGDIQLVKQNITSILITQLGFRIRQEDFGSRLWEAIEEQNTQLMQFLVKDYIKSSIIRFETRIDALEVIINSTGSTLYILIGVKLKQGSTPHILNYSYNLINNTIDVN